MSDRGRKESTPPHLVKMPAGGGLTLDVTSTPNLLMPVIQGDSSLLMTEEDGEADSFLGQSPPKTTGAYFQQQSNTVDPFSQIGQNSFTPLQHAGSTDKRSGYTRPTFAAPPSTGSPQVTATSNTPKTNIYRQQGPPRYASPMATYANASIQDPQVAPSPFTPSFSDSPVKSVFPPPMVGHSGQSNMPTKPPMTLNPHGIYQPVQMHWCFCYIENERDIWRPFSLVDSLNLEEAFSCEEQTPDTIVRTDGGRYDVSLHSRQRHAVYWEEPITVVRRCSWFYKREVDGKYVPYSEDFADKLEVEYKNAVANNLWHKRLEFDQGETIVMHNPNVIVHFQPSSQPDEWGTVQGDQMRPRVVKRGVDDFETINDGEPSHVDHLVFVVHGIGSACDMKLRSIVDCVDDFRGISLNLIKSHFKGHVIDRRIGRTEFLPVHWHTALHSDATGIDERLKLITLRSTAKLREFVNDTLLDVLFYTSPTYCQKICDTVASEMNRLLTLFKSRHPYFNGSTSVIGHSLGSSILYDILSHQHDPHQAPPPDTTSHPHTPTHIPPHEDALTNGTSSPVFNQSLIQSDNIDSSNGSAENEEMTLEDLLARVGLSDKMGLFEQEQIDMDSIGMCSDSDLKDLGLPMGPRKKLQGLLKLEEHKKNKKRVESAERERREAEERMREESRRRSELERQAEIADIVQQNGARSSVSVEYLEGEAGTGQPLVKYPQLDFTPAALFALGSPIGVFLTIRGVGRLEEEYQLPTCPRVFNIYHPFDPVAYRIEPLLNENNTKIKPVLIPHHKGRKRLHLELKEGLTRVGADLKQRIITTLRTTWNSVNEFARAHRGEEVDAQVDDAIKQMTDNDDKIETASLSSCHDEDIPMGSLNGGRRIDYVLQEKPIESFNDYLFALASHLCYWESEDTVLLVLKELYAQNGIYPTMTAETPRDGPRLPTLSPVSGSPSPVGGGPPLATTGPPLVSSGPLNGSDGTPMVPGNSVGMGGQPFVPLIQQNQQIYETNNFAGPPPLSGFMRT